MVHSFFRVEATNAGLGVGKIFLVPSAYANGDCKNFFIPETRIRMIIVRILA